MSSSRIVLAAACLLTAGGCIVSSDEHEVPGVADSWQPEFYATVDSVYVWFPCDWPDSTTWTWNRMRDGSWEYTMDASVKLANWRARPRTAHLAFVVRSDGTGARTGTFRDMARDADGYMWLEDGLTGDDLGDRIPFGTVRVLQGGVLVRAWRPWGEYIYGNLPERPAWIAGFERRGKFERKQTDRPAHYVFDTAQETARAVHGPLTPDDYAIMDVVARSYLRKILDEPLMVVSPTQTYVWSNEANNIGVLSADDETIAAFSAVRVRPLDVRAMSQVGYQVVDETAIPAGHYVRFSAIGYNRDRTQAMLYGMYHCGNLCAEGEILYLRKFRGYWVIQNRVGLWIS